MILNAVYSLLTNHDGLAELVSNRIYPVTAPQGAEMPYVVMHIIDTVHQEALSGSSGLARSLLQINSFALERFALVAPIAEQVRQAVQGFQGTAGGVYIDGVNMAGERSAYNEPQSGQDPGVFEIQTDIAFWHVESVPVFN